MLSYYELNIESLTQPVAPAQRRCGFDGTKVANIFHNVKKITVKTLLPQPIPPLFGRGLRKNETKDTYKKRSCAFRNRPTRAHRAAAVGGGCTAAHPDLALPSGHPHGETGAEQGRSVSRGVRTEHPRRREGGGKDSAAGNILAKNAEAKKRAAETGKRRTPCERSGPLHQRFDMHGDEGAFAETLPEPASDVDRQTVRTFDGHRSGPGPTDADFDSDRISDAARAQVVRIVLRRIGLHDLHGPGLRFGGKRAFEQFVDPAAQQIEGHLEDKTATPMAAIGAAMRRLSPKKQAQPMPASAASDEKASQGGGMHLRRPSGRRANGRPSRCTGSAPSQLRRRRPRR